MALLNFYGTECPHCIEMHKLCDRLEKEKGIVIEKIEVWHDDENMKKLEAIDNGDLCGGVPFFYNTETKTYLCGESDYKELEDWATNKNS